jgi:anti-sigma factor RsiW
MNPVLCQLLDDYLAHDLAKADCARFTAHLANCAACRQAVSEQDRFDRLLEQVVDHLNAVPERLVEATARRCKRQRRIRQALVATGLVAASIFLALLLLPRKEAASTTPESAPEAVVKVEPLPSPPQVAAQPHVAVRFPTSANVMAVPLETSNPHVTIVWTYPSLRQPPPEAAAPSSDKE